MPEISTYDYAIVRVVPRVERGEFVNVGVIVSCDAKRYLQARIEVDEASLRALDPAIDLAPIRAALATIPAICAGGAQAGALGSLSLRERFHWLVATRSTSVQTSPVHTGRCTGLDAALERLLDRMVRRNGPAQAAAERVGSGAAPSAPAAAAQAAPVPLRRFESIADLIHAHALARPAQMALQQDDEQLDYRALDTLMDRVAAALQRDGVGPGDAVAICADTSPRYAAIFLGALRAGAAVAPLAPSVSPQSFASMLADAAPRRLFADAAAHAALDGKTPAVPTVALDTTVAGVPFDTWLAPAGTAPRAVETQPEWPCNIIYSSGTTGTPKGIVQSHGMRASHIERGSGYGYGPDTVTLLATPLYSNTTLVVFFPTLAHGGGVVLMAKFDAARYLALAEAQRATHTMLVPVQYQRIMARPDFGRYDLSSFHAKFCTSAPFAAALKADVLARWPGGLVEFYGMTEGGGTCILNAHLHPAKLHTVGTPTPGHDIRLIDDAGSEVAAGGAGEVVGHSRGMMLGYHGRPELTAAAEWFDPSGKRFIRTGDIGRFDGDGFLTLLDRKKDLIISGGFNIYPSDLEAVLRGHPAVAEAAVVGVASAQWGETPVAFVVARSAEHNGVESEGDAVDASAAGLKAWLNERVGKTQRVADVVLVDELPRSAIGKVLKRELRDRYDAERRAEAAPDACVLPRVSDRPAAAPASRTSA